MEENLTIIKPLGYCKKCTVITRNNINAILKKTLSWLTKDNSNTTKIK